MGLNLESETSRNIFVHNINIIVQMYNLTYACNLIRNPCIRQVNQIQVNLLLSISSIRDSTRLETAKSLPDNQIIENDGDCSID